MVVSVFGILWEGFWFRVYLKGFIDIVYVFYFSYNKRV